jgi:hypothetical protein
LELAGSSGFVDSLFLSKRPICARTVTGIWSSPRSSLTFTRCQGGLRGLPERASPLVILASPTETHNHPVLPLERGSSHGIRTSPSPVHYIARPLPAGLQSHLRPPGTIRRGHVPPARFLSALMAFSEQEPQVCCTLLPVMGSAAFQDTLVADSRASHRTLCLSPTARTPFGVFPSSTAVPRHRGRSLLVVTDRSARAAKVLPSPARFLASRLTTPSAPRPSPRRESGFESRHLVGRPI